MDPSIPPSDLQRIFSALEFSSIKHRDQRRKDSHSTPYINHPIGVANNLIKIAGVTDANVIMAGILHDTVEDTQTTYQELVDNFGLRVADIVMECTDDKNLPKEERKRLQVVNASHKSHEARLVKMSDKLYNLRDLLYNPPTSWSQERINEYFAWARKVTEQITDADENLAKALEQVFLIKRAKDTMEDL